MKRGFTVVEIIVVITILSIILALTTIAYSEFRSKAHGAQVRSLANSVRTAAEKYHNNNLEYPSGNLLDTSNSCTGPSDYSNIKKHLGLDRDSVDNPDAKLVTRAGGECSTASLSQNNVYYYTKLPSDGTTTTRTYTFGTGCTYTVGNGDAGSEAYLLAYWDFANERWHITKSDHGTVATSNFLSCPILPS